MENHDAKAKFLLAIHSQTLKHYDAGGTVLGGPSGGGAVQSGSNPNQGFLGSVGNTLGLNNNFQAGAANIQAGTNVGQLNNAYTGAQQGLAGQQAFAQQAAAQNGFGNQANTFAQQQALSNQLQAQARGEGPNPAQAALNNATGQNVNNQAALMASQRGAGANAGLIARQAGMQGANIQQQAAGQGAVMQAQQQLAAQSALANQQAQMQGVAANQIAAQGQGATNYSSAQQGEQGILQGANQGFNNAGVTMQGNINNANAQAALANQQSNGKLFGGLTSGLSAAAGLFAHGGEVKMAEGGPISFAGQWLNNAPMQSSAPQMESMGAIPQNNDNSMAEGMKQLGTAEHTAFENSIPALEKGGDVKAKDPKQKAVKEGDSYSNDKIPALLSEGEVVIDRDTMKDPGPVGKMARALAAHIEKRNKKK